MSQKIIKPVAILFSVIVLICFGYFYTQINSAYDGEDTFFTISPGQGFSKINYNLSEEKIISNPGFFHRYVKLKGELTSFKAGTYEIKNGMTLSEVLYELTQGQPILTKITIPEGKNLYEVAALMQESKVTKEKDFIKAAKSSELLKKYNIKAPSLEGYLYPETYKFAPKSNAKNVVMAMVDVFNSKTKNLDFSKSKLTKHEVVILASIVEKETGASWERPTIAGVYLNRLKRPMRLQADPTTIYGIWEKYKGNLRKRHLLEKTAYNTYRIDGLPLGPIANPSTAALSAVLNPAKHSFLYFVSKNDGTHIFTPTYKEHLRAVREFQLNIKNRKGKSWRDLKKKQ